LANDSAPGTGYTFLERKIRFQRLLRCNDRHGSHMGRMTRPQGTFEDIVRDHGAMIRRIAMSYESAPDLAEELVQEIYFAIWRALPSFRGEASLRTFVAHIATNRAVTHVARAMKAPPWVGLDGQIPSGMASPEHQAIARDRRAVLMTAVRRLPLTYRQPVMLVLEGLTFEEAGEVLGITSNAVGVRMSRAKQLLKSSIGGNDHES
jgi:RNA polymerase sigma-70 factor, ECF subfamily